VPYAAPRLQNTSAELTPIKPIKGKRKRKRKWGRLDES
jgi:hypothetical protein